MLDEAEIPAAESVHTCGRALHAGHQVENSRVEMGQAS